MDSITLYQGANFQGASKDVTELLPCISRDFKFQILAESVLQIQEKDTRSAQQNLQKLINNLVKNNEDSIDLQYFLFALALNKQIEGNFSTENLYLRNYNEISQIDIFDLVSTQLPLASLTHPIANELICKIINNRSSIVLLNIGIGKGTQEVDLLRRLKKQGIKPQSLTIIGIEPSAEVLSQAEYQILNVAKELDFNLNFISIAKVVEELTEQEWSELGNIPGDLIINEAFSLHHIVSSAQENDIRQQVIFQLSQLNPVAFILIEPNSNHNISDLWIRFNNAWNHYGLVFKLIDNLAISPQSKRMLKVQFFGREIEDILGNSEETRCERHEDIDTWLARLYKAGFKPYMPNTIINLSHPLVNISEHTSYISIDYEQTPLVAIMSLQR